MQESRLASELRKNDTAIDVGAGIMLQYPKPPLAQLAISNEKYCILHLGCAVSLSVFLSGINILCCCVQHVRASTNMVSEETSWQGCA